MRLKPFNPDKELKKSNRKYTKKQLITTLLVLVVMITIGSSYAIFSIQPEYHTFIKSQVGEFSTGDIKLSVLVEGVAQSEFPAKGTGYAYEKVECDNGSTGTWNADTWQLTLTAKGPDKCTVSFKKMPTLTELLLAQYQDGASTGLVKDVSNPNLYYYTGTNEQVANNFLWYGGHQWRVLEFDDSAKTITLITQQPLTAIQPASAVWTSASAYDSSYINQWLNTYFYNSLDSSVQATIQNSTFNIGIYSNVSEFTTTKKVGLLDETQYEIAGSSDSFLDIKDFWLLGNRYSSSSIRYVRYNGILDVINPSNSSGLGARAVIKISDLTITGGDGTLANNYRTSTKATNTSDIQVGEYINVPYKGSDNACGSDKLCTMRVVSKSANGIKVVLNGLLPTTSAWADSASDNITTNDTVYTNVLNPFIGNIDGAYITTGSFGVGMYEDGNSYTVPAATTISANVGLPTVGEMFSGNDIDMGSSKTFVDVATIENSTASNYYWMMNRYSSSIIHRVSDHGNLEDFFPSDSYGVRAVFYLKSGTSALTFTGGEGTPQNPYTLN